MKRKVSKPRVTNSKLIVAEPSLSNGLAEAVLGSTGSIFGLERNGLGTQLNQVDTLFKNNRTYLISNLRQLLSQTYVEHGLVQTVVDVPVDDGLRGGVEIKSKQLDPIQIEELQQVMDREDILNSSIGQGMKWNRLFGGAGNIIMTDQDPSTPLELSQINENSNLEFRAVDMWELFYDKQDTEGYNPTTQMENYQFFDYYGTKIHKSRVMKMKGIIAPSFIRPRLRGWGVSVLEVLVNSINQYLKSNNLTFEVLDEFKIDYFKIKNLSSNLVSPGGTQKVQQRMQIMNQQKNYQHAVTMDAEDDYIQKQLSFAGINDTMTGIRMQIASDLRMPLTKIFGISAQGFNAGEEDLENYNAMVESQIRAKCKYDILRVVELLCQKYFSFIPDDLSLSFKPLRMLSAEQEQNVKTQQFTRLLQAKQANEITSLEFRDGCNKDNLLGIQLDTDQQTMDDLEQEDPNQGADQEDSRSLTAPKKLSLVGQNTTKPKDAPVAKS